MATLFLQATAFRRGKKLRRPCVELWFDESRLRQLGFHSGGFNTASVTSMRTRGPQPCREGRRTPGAASNADLAFGQLLKKMLEFAAIASYALAGYRKYRTRNLLST
jgi:hypothetical protein